MKRRPTSPARARLYLAGLALLFMAPLLIAASLYYFGNRLPTPRVDSNGDLLLPARPIDDFEVRDLAGRPLDPEYLRGKWTLVYVGGSRCNLWCEASLFKMRQVRLTLGRDQDRVRRLYLLIDTRALARLRPLLHRHRGMALAIPREGATHRLLNAFGRHPSGTLFLIDPHANLMMRYPPDTTARGLQEDLHRLLEVSRIG